MMDAGAIVLIVVVVAITGWCLRRYRSDLGDLLQGGLRRRPGDEDPPGAGRAPHAGPWLGPERHTPTARGRAWPGRTPAEPVRRPAPGRPGPRVAGARAITGTRFTPPDAICPACGRQFEDCARPTACLGRDTTHA